MPQNYLKTASKLLVWLRPNWKLPLGKSTMATRSSDLRPLMYIRWMWRIVPPQKLWKEGAGRGQKGQKVSLMEKVYQHRRKTSDTLAIRPICPVANICRVCQERATLKKQMNLCFSPFYMLWLVCNQEEGCHKIYDICLFVFTIFFHNLKRVPWDWRTSKESGSTLGATLTTLNTEIYRECCPSLHSLVPLHSLFCFTNNMRDFQSKMVIWDQRKLCLLGFNIIQEKTGTWIVCLVWRV